MKRYWSTQARFKLSLWLCAVLLPLVAAHGQSNYATPYTFATLAGEPLWGSADGIGSVARFNHPTSIARDALGNLYVADTLNMTIRKISPAGVVTTLAGSPGIADSADGTGSAARFIRPAGVAVDQVGNVYVADLEADKVRKVTPAGAVTTVTEFNIAVGGVGTSRPHEVTVDASGNIYILSQAYPPFTNGGSAITKITPAGVKTMVRYWSRYTTLGSLAIDADGNLFVSIYDGNGVYIEKITPGGTETPFAGHQSQTGTADGAGDAARFINAGGLSFDAAGILYVADSGRIRKIDPLGEVTTLVPTTVTPVGELTVDAGGNVYVAGTNNTIVKVSAIGEVTPIAGLQGPWPQSVADGSGSAARFFLPYGIVKAPNGPLYVTDEAGIRKVTTAGEVTTLATLGRSRAVAVDSASNLYVGILSQNGISKVTPSGVVTPLAGSAGMQYAGGIVVDVFGNVFVTYNQTIQKITPDGNATNFAGGVATTGSADGTGGFARFSSPAGLAIDGAGNLYVADSYNCTIRKITPSRVVTTIAGTAGTRGSADGVGSAARFNSPIGLAIDDTGYLYVTEFDGNTIRRISPAGEVTTIGGLPTVRGSTDGSGIDAHFNNPTGITIGANGMLYVADYFNCTIRTAVLPGAPSAPTITTQPVSQHVLVGGSMGFTVVANSPTAVTHQWQKNGVDIGGATGALFQIASTAMADAGTYRVVVSNGFGSVISETVLLSVDDSSGAGGPVILLENAATGQRVFWQMGVGSSRVDLQACKLEYSIVSPK